MAQTIDGDKAIVFWSSARIRRATAEKAFAAVQKEDLVPKADYFTALKSAVIDTCSTYNVQDDGPVKPYGLSGHGNGVGVEARRFMRGTTRNDLPFLFSAGAMRQSDGTYRVELLEVDDAACPQIARNKRKAEAQIDAAWRSQCDYLAANDLTQAITGLVKANHGFLLRDEGVVWYMPEDSLSEYETVGNLLAEHGVKMLAVRFRPVVNKSLIKHVSDELIRRSLAVFNGHIEDMEELQQRGAKPRSNGQQTRLEEWIAAEECMQANKGLLGKAFSHVAKAARLAREKIGEAALEAFA
jgi:hypothetical protein